MLKLMDLINLAGIRLAKFKLHCATGLMRMFRIILAASAILVLCTLSIAGAPGKNSVTSGTVTDVYDGDTLTIKSEGALIKCRLLGIDTPEMSYSRLWTEMDKVSKYAPVAGRRELLKARQTYQKWAKVMEGHAQKSRDTLKSMVLGKTVRLAYDSKQPGKDRYGRHLVYVALKDMDVNAEMLRRGTGVADTRFSTDRLYDYVKLWRAAQKGRKGVWAALSKAGARAKPGKKEDEKPPEISRKASKYHFPNCRYAARTSKLGESSSDPAPLPY